jgi:DNA ligase (NAD+)
MNNKAFIKFINSMTLSELQDLQSSSDHLFFNTGDASSLTDEQYDLLVETINKINWDSGEKKRVGAKLREDDNRSKLPYPLWSMDKASDEKKLTNWIKKNDLENFIVEDKLDGVSCLAVYSGAKWCKLYTRGDGVTGADISYLADHLHNLPLFLQDDIVVRGELIIPRNVFTSKYAGDAANARNMVSGCVNAKSLKTGVEDIHFVAYEIISIGKCDKPSEQLKRLKDLKFEVVSHLKPDVCDFDSMETCLTEMKYVSKYEIDGIIIQPDTPYVRCETGNPKYAIAFKQQFGENIARTKIVKIHWEVTKWNLIKPRVEIEPVELGGVVITFVTAYNAKYVVDNRLGAGALIDVTRAGDVIPKILFVAKQAIEPDMPSFEYDWNSTAVDINACEVVMLAGVKMTAGFFEKIGVKHVGEKIVEKLYKDGYNSIIRILEMTEEQMVEVDGFGVTLAKRTYTNIHTAVSNSTTDVLMGSSGVLGYGVSIKKVNALLDGIPDLLTTSSDGLLERIIKVDGFSNKSAIKVIENLQQAKDFLEEIKPYQKTKPIVVEKKQQVVDKITVVISGFRDKEFEKNLTDLGYKICTSVSKNTNFLITVPDAKPSAKLTKARELGIEIVNKDDFAN